MQGLPAILPGMPALRVTTFLALSCAALALPSSSGAQATDPSPRASDREIWNMPQQPFRIYGNTYYVGTHGLGAILIASPAGHVLIDGALPESAPLIMASIRSLGFHVEDIKLIVNSHDHYDHAGGIAALHAASGALVAASPGSAMVLRRGASGNDDPQYGLAPPFPAVDTVKVIADGDTLRVGGIAITAHFTPGHTPGGTSWTWRSCDAGECRDFVYADSESPVSADGFLFTRSTTYPSALRDFERGQAVIEGLPCDILLTPHPDASSFWQRVAARDRGDRNGLVDRGACRRYAAWARQQVAQRVRRETGTQ
jgi:metallo-beta-lactamase class B